MRISQSQSRRLAALLVGGFFAVGIAYFLINSATTTTPIGMPAKTINSQEQDSSKEQSGTALLQEFHRTETKDGKPIWEISAKQGQYLSQGGGVKLVAPRLTMFRSAGQTVNVEAETATVFIEGAALKNAELSKAVKITLDSKTSISTELATYDKSIEAIASPGPVKISAEMITISGDSLKGNIANSEFVISGNVDSVINPGSK